MSKEELKKWMAESKLVDSGREFDGNDNRDEWLVYERDGKLYMVELLNGHPYKKWEGKGPCGVYGPREVVRETEMVEVVRYREPNER
ncbi:MAG: hypothetical protein WCL11_20105 [Verrucomicrobiota bacterium]